MWKKVLKIVDKFKANKQKSQLIVLVTLFVFSGSYLVYSRHSRESTATNQSHSERPVEKRKTSTKLSFADEKKLPKTYSPGEKLTLSFTIQNHEGKTVDYLYTVSVNGKQVAAHSLTVKDKTDQNVEQAFVLPTDEQNLLVSVKLPTQNQEIHFSLDRAK